MNNWIKVKDQLPKDDEPVEILIVKFGYRKDCYERYIGFYESWDKQWYISHPHNDYSYDENNADYMIVTYWKPLSDLPDEL